MFPSFVMKIIHEDWLAVPTPSGKAVAGRGVETQPPRNVAETTLTNLESATWIACALFRTMTPSEYTAGEADTQASFGGGSGDGGGLGFGGGGLDLGGGGLGLGGGGMGLGGGHAIMF